MKKNSELYNSLLADTNLIFPQKQENVEYNYAYYPVIFESHEQMLNVRQALFENEIYPRRYFYPSLNTLPYLKAPIRRCQVSERIAERVLCLPLYYGLEENHIRKITEIIKRTLSL